VKLRGRSAVITGASQGLGKTVAEAYVREGAHVLLAARNEGLLRRAADEVARRHATSAQRIETVPADVSQADGIERLLAAA
jgi:short-subunit dehydrogenase